MNKAVSCLVITLKGKAFTDSYILMIERELITPPLNGLILPGITRDSILHLAREWRQFKVTERPINMFEVKKALYENRVSSESSEFSRFILNNSISI